MSRKLLITALFAAQAVWAAPQEQMLYYRDGVRIDPVEVSRILAGPKLTRSIRLLPEAPRDDTSTALALPATAAVGGGGGSATARPVAAASVESVELAPEPSQPASIAVPVQFAFDSAEILPRARAQLDAVAEGIKMLPATHNVTIEGHTDALGTHEYNLQLSRRRAEAVKHYLVAQHGLSAQRLKTVGYGEGRPIDGDAARPENRRVQFRGA
jgi:outer membrane protein OmpA-like peptidoglycan-associated protein